jgi:hypothetical protein
MKLGLHPDQVYYSKVKKSVDDSQVAIGIRGQIGIIFPGIPWAVRSSKADSASFEIIHGGTINLEKTPWIGIDIISSEDPEVEFSAFGTGHGNVIGHLKV